MAVIFRVRRLQTMNNNLFSTKHYSPKDFFLWYVLVVQGNTHVQEMSDSDREKSRNSNSYTKIKIYYLNHNRCSLFLFEIICVMYKTIQYFVIFFYFYKQFLSILVGAINNINWSHRDGHYYRENESIILYIF